MSRELFTITVGGLRMRLLESHGASRYTMLFNIVSEPQATSITYLGPNRERAWHIFARKVELHRTLIGEINDLLGEV